MTESRTTENLCANPPSENPERDLMAVTCGGWSLLIRAGLRANGFERVVAAGESELRRQYGAEQVPCGASSRVLRFQLPDGGARAYYKEYFARSVWDALKHKVRASRARRAFRASRMLTAQGLETPAVLALGERPGFVRAGRCFLVTAEIADAEPLYALLGQDAVGLAPPSLRSRRSLIRTLGHTIGRMHACGIVHGDLRPGNVLVRREDETWHLFFLDNERTRRYPWLPPWLRRKNLVQIGMIPTLSRTDRFRFWRAYLAECPRLRSRHKQWAWRVHDKTMWRLRRSRYKAGTSSS